MQHLFVEYELALKLKEAGFSGACAAFYDYKGRLHPNVQEAGVCVLEFKAHEFADYEADDMVFINFDPNTIEDTEDVAAPIYQQVFDWLETKGLHIECLPDKLSLPYKGKWSCSIYDTSTMVWTDLTGRGKKKYDDKKLARIESIEQSLEILKQRA